MWEQGFGVFWKVLAAVGRIEAFGEDNEVRAGARGFKDAVAGASEVVGFVGTCSGGFSEDLGDGRGGGWG